MNSYGENIEKMKEKTITIKEKLLKAIQNEPIDEIIFALRLILNELEGNRKIEFEMENHVALITIIEEQRKTIKKYETNNKIDESHKAYSPTLVFPKFDKKN